MKLKRYEKYSREDVHNIFAPNENFTNGAGSWGLHGIIDLGNKNYIFFVTLGTKVGKYKFEEGIDTEGILSWQGQPHQGLEDKKIKDFINHNPEKNTIYLFYRIKSEEKYIYVGQLKYLNHDDTREKPIYFKWRILDFDYDKIKSLGINLTENKDYEKLLDKKVVLAEKPKKPVIKGNNSSNFYHNIYINEDNYLERKHVGDKGEEAVLKYEKEKLKKINRDDLSEKVKLTRETKGNAAPYDIDSFDLNGNPIYIEVKTTLTDFYNTIYISAPEVQFSHDNSQNYYLYRLYDYDKETGVFQYFIQNGQITESMLEVNSYYLKLDK